jgi:DNA-binding MarR family transcriptional regulator
MNQKSGAVRSPSAQGFTEKQGQYLAFIYTYSHMFRRPPAETDMQRHFQVSPPSVHQMIVTLERNGLIRRQPGVARSIQNPRCSGRPAHPGLAQNQPIIITVPRY